MNEGCLEYAMRDDSLYLSVNQPQFGLLAIASPSEPRIFLIYCYSRSPSLSSDKAEDCNWQVHMVDGIYTAVDPSCNDHEVDGFGG